ncbi:Long chain fatty acid CoA ligase 4, partial [Aduncisulcus paluster]
MEYVPPTKPIIRDGAAHFPIQRTWDQVPDDMETLPQFIRHHLKVHWKRPAFGAYRSYCLPNEKEKNPRGAYEYYTYEHFSSHIAKIAAGLRSIGLEKGDAIGIWSYNRYEWHVLDLACNCEGFILVPLYDSQGIQDCKYVANDSQIKCLFMTADILPKFLKIESDMPECLSNVYLFDYRPDDRAMFKKYIPELTPDYIFHRTITEAESHALLDSMFLNVPPGKEFYEKLKDCKEANPEIPMSPRNVKFPYSPPSHVLPTISFPDKEIFSHITGLFSSLMVLGANFLISEGGDLTLPRVPPGIHKDELVSYVYTSGTTGNPKGVELSHYNIVKAVYLFQPALYKGYQKQHVFMSFLPSAHVFQRVVSMVVVQFGGVMCFYRGNTKYLIDDIFIARPTVLCAVPRVLQKIFDSVMKKVKKKPGLIRWLFLHGLSRVKHWKYVQQRLKIPTKYDFLFKDVRNLLGNRCKQIVSGSAPLSPECAAFVGCAMGVELTE